MRRVMIAALMAAGLALSTHAPVTRPSIDVSFGEIDPRVEGKVVAVQSDEGVVVLSVGSDNKVERSRYFYVFRKNR